jgi:hypothetical protein
MSIEEVEAMTEVQTVAPTYGYCHYIKLIIGVK